MIRKMVIYSLSLAVFLSVIFLNMVVSHPAQGKPLFQGSPTEEQQTIDASVNQLFTQTAQAQQQQQRMTQTVAAAFSHALTATANAQPTAAATIAATRSATTSAFSVTELTARIVNQFDMLAGPARTSAFLSPDGKRFVYFGSKKGSNNLQACFYSFAGEQQNCSDLTVFPDYSRSVNWSPDGKWVVFATDFYRSFQISNIWVINTTTGAVTNLTNNEARVFPLDATTNVLAVDLLPRWSADSKRVIFVRYTRLFGKIIAALYAISPEGGMPQLLGPIIGIDKLDLSSLAVAPDGSGVAYDRYTSDASRGVWFNSLDGQNPKLLLKTDQPRQVISFSPDSHFLITQSPDNFGLSSIKPEQSPYRILAVDGGSEQLIDSNNIVTAVGWAPSGSALAYIARNFKDFEKEGLYLAQKPGDPGILVLKGQFSTPDTYQLQLTWSADNTILLGKPGGKPIYAIQLEKK